MRQFEDTYYPVVCRVKGDKIVMRMPDLFGYCEFYAPTVEQAKFIMQQHAQAKIWDLKFEKKEIPTPSKFYRLGEGRGEWVLMIPVEI